jgi:hypothetical protein
LLVMLNHLPDGPLASPYLMTALGLIGPSKKPV